ncbi:hypothetical protein CA606_09215 [Caulobacter vibrioides]|uniref:Bro-N domain-containing protein n=1 Tax=Caulobacter vibrioides TaxID=155892 RepID=A0A290MY17_CAUVI|nr:BRO family protein [Caulobacter vibrioides]ATC32513.1 hypothetical protein CA606_09215 [Caulobacter vibrioides]
MVPTTFTFQPAGRDEPVNIRTTMLDGEPWFFGTDVIAACGIASGTRGATYARLAADRKRMVGRTNLGLPPGRDIVLVSEPGLYDIVIRSDKPEARTFQDWVTGTVLPSIRKTGGYLLNEAARETAYADKREAMPLPMDIAEAMALAMKPVVEELASVKALLAATLQQRETDALDDLKRNQMFLARDLQKRGIGRGLQLAA